MYYMTDGLDELLKQKTIIPQNITDKASKDYKHLRARGGPTVVCLFYM